MRLILIVLLTVDVALPRRFHRRPALPDGARPEVIEFAAADRMICLDGVTKVCPLGWWLRSLTKASPVNPPAAPHRGTLCSLSGAADRVTGVGGECGGSPATTLRRGGSIPRRRSCRWRVDAKPSTYDCRHGRYALDAVLIVPTRAPATVSAYDLALSDKYAIGSATSYRNATTLVVEVVDY